MSDSIKDLSQFQSLLLTEPFVPDTKFVFQNVTWIRRYVRTNTLRAAFSENGRFSAQEQNPARVKGQTTIFLYDRERSGDHLLGTIVDGRATIYGR